MVVKLWSSLDDNALNLATRAYVLMRGSVVLEGDPKTLAASPQLKDAYLGMACTGQ